MHNSKFMIMNLDFVYPIGSIYLSINSTNPSKWFGGTWVAWGTGRVPVGVDTSQTEFNTVEKTGGSKYIQNHTHTCDPGYGNMYFASGSESRWLPLYGTDQYNMHTKGVDSNVTTGDSGNLQPYITCYMWKRTA